MSTSRTFGKPGESSYTLVIDDAELQLNCYLKGSLAGGTGTECFHTIDGTKMADYFTAIGVKDGFELSKQLETCGARELAAMHSTFMKYQTGSFVWVETDWSD